MLRLSVFRRVFGLLAQHRAAATLGLACVPAAAALSLAMPILAGRALDAVAAAGAGEGAKAALWWSCAALLAAGVGEAVLRLLARRKLIDTSRRVEEQLKTDLMAHLVRLPVAWYDRARTGDLISRLTQDVELLRFLIGPALLHGGVGLVVVPGGLYLMASLSWKVCAAAAAAFALLLGALAVLLPRLHASSTAVQESIAAISQRAAEDFAGIRVLLTFGRAGAEVEALRALAQRYVADNVKLTRVRALLDLFIHLVGELVVLAVLVVGVLEALAGRLTLGELFQFVMLTHVMLWPLLAASWISALLPRSVAAAERVEELFALAPEELGGKSPPLRGRLEVRDLTFHYGAGPSVPALHGVSFRLEPGQRLGLVGPVGAGKSTLLALLLGLYEAPPGTIFLDGYDVRELSRSALRSVFAVAPQDPFLFSDTIRGNVGFGAGGNARDRDDELMPAVHASALDQDLDSFPDGLESVVGERGITLSGGQRQRVSLARALAAGRPALVLDDTLSAVDHRTEAMILERLARGFAGTTMVVASHRLSAVVDCDLILVLDGGRVVERGTHAELVRRGGYYAAAWARQRERDALQGPV